MDLGSILGAGLGLFGQKEASDSAKDAAQAQVTAAAIAAEQSKFTPYGVTTGFGTSYFDPEKGTAGYDLDPALAAYRDRLLMMGTQALPQDLDVASRTSEYYNQMQDLMEPRRAQERVQMQQDLFGSGRLGMRLAGEGAGAGAGGMYQPDVLGYNKAQELANQQLAMQARQQALNELDASISRGTGLFTSGLGVEELGLKPLSIGAELGGRSATAGATAGQQLLQGGMGAAQANLAAGMGWANTLGDIGGRLMSYGGFKPDGSK